MRRVMRLPPHVQIEYKKHVDSLADKSSFRNPSLVWKPKENLHQNKESHGHYNKEGREGGHHYTHHNKEGGGGGHHYNKDNVKGNNQFIFFYS